MTETFTQTKQVNWLDTPKGTIYIRTQGNYIQPQNMSLRTTELGVNLSLIEDQELFSINSEMEV